MKKIILLLLSFVLFFNCKAQNFQNGDLEGVVIIGNDLPNFWQNVPFNDLNCNATLTLHKVGFLVIIHLTMFLNHKTSQHIDSKVYLLAQVMCL